MNLIKTAIAYLHFIKARANREHSERQESQSYPRQWYGMFLPPEYISKNPMPHLNRNGLVFGKKSRLVTRETKSISSGMSLIVL